MSLTLLRDRVVVVTGGSAGLGLATATAFAEQGAQLALIARDQARLEQAARGLTSRYGVRALPISADVASAEAVEAAAEQIEEQLGPIDIWVNNAMTTVFAPVDQIAPAEYARATEVTYLGGVYGTMAALKRMQRRDRGVIVQVGSALAYRAIPLQSAYCASKFALRGFTDSLRCELMHQQSRIHITMVHMPALNTPQFDWCLNRMPREAQPVPPIFQPEVGARAIVWAATHRRRELYVGYPSWKTILGTKLFPALTDRLAVRKAWAGQMTSEPRRLAASNLFQAVPGPASSHGRFDSRSRRRSVELWFAENRAWFLPVALVTAGVSLGLALRGRS